MPEEIQNTEEIVGGDGAPKGMTPDDVSVLVASAIKSDREAEEARQLKRAEERDELEKAAEALAQKKFEAMAGSRGYSVAIRTQGIQKDNFDTRFANVLRSKPHTHASAMKDLMEIPGVYEGETLTDSEGNTYESDFQFKFSDLAAARAKAGAPRIGSKGYVKSLKASNATDYNIGTAADGGNTVPTGFYDKIIRRRDEIALHTTLGCRSIPGTGTTVDVSFSNEADGEFVTVGEATQFDEDAAAVGKVSLTLVDYTKRSLISYQLMRDTGDDFLDFVQDEVAMGWAKTINNLIVTEAETCTQYKRGGTITGYTFGDLEDVVYNNTIAPYLSDGNALAWVGQPASYGNILKIVGNDRQYGGAAGFMNSPAQGGFGSTNRQLLQYPFYLSNKVDAIGARGKSLLFGAWNYMLYRESPALQFILDPYTRADYGQNRLLWFMRWDFQAGIDNAIGYFEHDLT